MELLNILSANSRSILFVLFFSLCSVQLNAQTSLLAPHEDSAELGWWNNRVFYEIFVRSFYDSDGDGIGDFNGITQKLDYLNDGDPTTDSDLGITGIWLMPIHPTTTYHGYDVTDYRAVNPEYGTMDEFKAFLSAAHERGIAVIIDFVMNHTSSEHPWFQKALNNEQGMRDFYRWSDNDPGDYWHNYGEQSENGFYYGFFWDGMPDLNYDTQAVKDSMLAVTDFWLTEVGVDGFRQDAIKYIDEDGDVIENTPETLEWWREYSAHIHQTAPNSFAVGEAATSTDEVQKYVNDDGIDFCFDFDLSWTIMSGTQYGYSQDIRTHIEKLQAVYPYQQYATFLGNHDIERIQTQLLTEGVGDPMGITKAAAAVLLTLPGIPFIYYGEELGLQGKKPDENIRKPMQWDSSDYAGFTQGTGWSEVEENYQENNVAVLDLDSNSLLRHYKKLIQIRNSIPALQTGKYSALSTSHEALYSFVRALPKDTALVIINLSDTQRENVEIHLSDVVTESGSYSWFDYFNKRDESVTISQNGVVHLSTMKPYSVKVFRRIADDALISSAERTKEESSSEEIPMDERGSSSLNEEETSSQLIRSYSSQILDISSSSEREPVPPVSSSVDDVADVEAHTSVLFSENVQFINNMGGDISVMASNAMREYSVYSVQGELIDQGVIPESRMIRISGLVPSRVLVFVYE